MRYITAALCVNVALGSSVDQILGGDILGAGNAVPMLGMTRSADDADEFIAKFETAQRAKLAARTEHIPEQAHRTKNDDAEESERDRRNPPRLSTMSPQKPQTPPPADDSGEENEPNGSPPRLDTMTPQTQNNTRQ